MNTTHPVHLRFAAIAVLLVAFCAWDCSSSCDGCCDSRTSEDYTQTTPTGSCKTDQDCSENQSCTEGTCVTKKAEAKTTGRSVPKRSFPSADNPVPAAGFDEPSIGTSCKSDSDCPGELKCAASNGQCVPLPACKTNDDCPKSTVCDATINRCREPICLDNNDCEDGEVCVYGACDSAPPKCYGASMCPKDWACTPKYSSCEKLNCSEDSHCAEGRVCHSGQCKNCSADEMCSEGLQCDIVGGYCVEKKLCTSDAHCLHDRICDAMTNTCQEPPCTPDQYEGNDKRERALEVTDGTYSFTRCDKFGNDWYSVYLEKGDGMLLWGNYGLPERSIVEFRLYDPGETIERKRITDNYASGRFRGLLERAPESGNYLIRAKRSAEGVTRYTMRIDTIRGGRCRDDSYEPNDKMDDATRLNMGGQIYTNKFCEDDEDWFTFDLGPGEVAQITMNVFKGNTPRLTMFRLVEEDGVKSLEVKGTTPDNNTSQIVRVASEEGDTFFVKAHSDKPIGNSEYQMILKQITGLDAKQDSGNIRDIIRETPLK